MTDLNPHLRAFSIIEAIVGMAVAAIVMGLTFVIFSIISERMMDFKKQNQLINDMNRLTYSVNKDIFESDKMSFTEQQLYFYGYSGENVQYNFNENQIIRYKQEFADTFKIPLKQILVDSVKSQSNRLVFQKIKLNVTINEKPMNLIFYKRIYANQLLEKMNEK